MEIKTKNRYEVTLLGQNFVLRSERSAAYVRAIANYVSEELALMQKNTKAVSTHHLTLLVCMNMADSLFRREEELDLVRKELQTMARESLNKIEKTLSDHAKHTESKPEFIEASS